MARNTALALGLFFAALSNALADVTQHQVTEIKYNPLLAQLGPEFKQMITSRVPQDTITRVKGDRAFTTISGISALINYGTKQITLLHPGIRQYASLTFADYVTIARAQQIVSPLPVENPKTVTGMKATLQRNKTGNTRNLRGIEAEEMLFTVSVETPEDSNYQGGFRMEIQVWRPKVGEMGRFPVLKELAATSARNEGVLDSFESLQNLVAQLPALQAPFREFLADLTRNASSPPLLMRIRVYSPMLEQLAKIIQMTGQKLAPDVDPAGPMADITIDWSNISADPLPDALFEIPVGYRQASLAEFGQALQTMQAPPATTSAPANLPLITESSLESTDKSVPSLIRSADPEYTPEAKKAKLQGSVLLQATVEVDGVAHELKVVRSLDAGLDQKAIEAAQKWKFLPAERDGAPYAMDVRIEIRFRLLER